MSEGRLPTETWVMAHVRRCNGEGVPAMVVRRGDRQGGIVVLKINQLEAGCRIFTQTRGLAGHLAWLPALNGALAPAAGAGAYIARQPAPDPHLWAVGKRAGGGDVGQEG